MNMTGLMNRYSSKDKLRAYYVRQLRASGYLGNGGGWVFAPSGARVQGWSVLLDALAASMDRLGRALAAPASRFEEAAANHAAHAAAKAARQSQRGPAFRQDFMKHLGALDAAVARTQPLAEYAGNFEALHALVTLKAAAETILADVDRILARKEA